MSVGRFICEECKTISRASERDSVADPKLESDVVWSICPHCRAADQWSMICDEPSCNERVSCGWPSETGYRCTCHKHSPWFKEAT